jgi:hypothetical protein
MTTFTVVFSPTLGLLIGLPQYMPEFYVSTMMLDILVECLKLAF